MMKSEWHKSSFSNGAQNCVEAREVPGGCVELRHSKDPDTVLKRFTAVSGRRSSPVSATVSSTWKRRSEVSRYEQIRER